MYKVIIIDDEERSIGNIIKYVNQYTGLEVLQTYSEPLLALKEIGQMKEKVDLIFMDVDMPLMTGIELAKAIRHKTDKLIFTTAHSEYAFDAYESNAEAFLLKPISFAKFAEKVSRVLPGKSLVSLDNEKSESNDFILVKSKEDENEIVKMELEDIVAFESDGNYLKIHSLGLDKPIISYLTLKDILDALKEKNVTFFLRVHRAFVISSKQMKSINGNMISMKNDMNIQAGGNYKDAIKSLLTKDLVTTSRRVKR